MPIDKYLPTPVDTVTEKVKGKKVQKQYYEDDSYSIRENDKVIRYFSDKSTLTYIKGSDKEFLTETFILNREEHPDGLVRQYYSDGRPSFEKLPNGTIRSWFENGNLEMEKLPDGTEREWYPDGKMSRAKLPNKTVIEWEHYGRSYGLGGKLKNEKINNVVMREWYENGRLAYVRSPNGKEVRYDKVGNIVFHATKGVEDTQKYLAKRKLAKRLEIMREKALQTNQVEIADQQYAISEKLRQKAIVKFSEEDLLASRLEKETKNKTEIKNKEKSDDLETLNNTKTDSTELSEQKEILNFENLEVINDTTTSFSKEKS